MTSLRSAIIGAADAIEASRDELGTLDSVAGDGDHGVTMAIAARNVRSRLDGAPGASGADLLREVVIGISSVGGAIGPIYATAISRIAATSPEGPVTTDKLSRWADVAEEAVMALGHAKPGDKTVLDALDPLVRSLGQSSAAGSDVKTAAIEAARSARTGADATADMIATVGRASRLGERSRGSADPGATSFAIIAEALVAALVDTTEGR